MVAGVSVVFGGVLCSHQYGCCSVRGCEYVSAMSRRPRPTGALHVVTNRRQGKGREYVTHLLRRSYREGAKVRNETVGNISHLPEELVELVRAGLRGEPVGRLLDALQVERSLPA